MTDAPPQASASAVAEGRRPEIRGATNAWTVSSATSSSTSSKYSLLSSERQTIPDQEAVARDCQSPLGESDNAVDWKACTSFLKDKLSQVCLSKLQQWQRVGSSSQSLKTISWPAPRTPSCPIQPPRCQSVKARPPRRATGAHTPSSTSSTSSSRKATPSISVIFGLSQIHAAPPCETPRAILGTSLFIEPQDWERLPSTQPSCLSTRGSVGLHVSRGRFH